MNESWKKENIYDKIAFDLPLLPNEHVVYHTEAKQLLRMGFIIATNKRLLIYSKGTKSSYTSIFYSKISQIKLNIGVFSSLLIYITVPKIKTQKIIFSNSIAAKSIFSILSYQIATREAGLQAFEQAQSLTEKPMGVQDFNKHAEANAEEAGFISMLMQVEKKTFNMQSNKIDESEVAIHRKIMRRDAGITKSDIVNNEYAIAKEQEIMKYAEPIKAHADTVKTTNTKTSIDTVSVSEKINNAVNEYAFAYNVSENQYEILPKIETISLASNQNASMFNEVKTTGNSILGKIRSLENNKVIMANEKVTKSIYMQRINSSNKDDNADQNSKSKMADDLLIFKIRKIKKIHDEQKNISQNTDRK
ncbi:MAG: PH domain-containing protein [Candidatus Micrarchaeaceae archaeon]